MFPQVVLLLIGSSLRGAGADPKPTAKFPDSGHPNHRIWCFNV